MDDAGVTGATIVRAVRALRNLGVPPDKIAVCLDLRSPDRAILDYIILHSDVEQCLGCGSLFQLLRSASQRECAYHPGAMDAESGRWSCCRTLGRSVAAANRTIQHPDPHAPHRGCISCDHHVEGNIPPRIVPRAAFEVISRIVSGELGRDHSSRPSAIDDGINRRYQATLAHPQPGIVIVSSIDARHARGNSH
jgi:hypothetical protein